jgi:hypothetical protein
LIAKRLNVIPTAVHAYVLGEHGDSQFAPYSVVTIGGASLNEHGLSEAEFSRLADQTKLRAKEIVKKKGSQNDVITLAMVKKDAFPQVTLAIALVSACQPFANLSWKIFIMYIRYLCMFRSLNVIWVGHP